MDDVEGMMAQDPVDTPGWGRLAEAAAYALAIHAAQRRKGTSIPYVSHLLAVAALVLEFGGDEDQAIAGLLHDAIEDCGAEQEPVILARFGPRVVAIVRGCTDADVQPKPPWRARKEAYLQHLEHAPADVLLVSCADKVHNARSIVTDLRTLGPAMFARFNAGRDGTLWYYGALSEAFQRRLPGTLAQELQLAVAEIDRLAGPPVAAPPFAHPFRLILNPRHGTPGVVVLNAAGFRRAREEITAWPGYAPTPLLPLPEAAARAGVAAVHMKDEASRFGLGSFKALGGAYAVLGVVLSELARNGGAPQAAAADLEAGRHRHAVTVCCATDGNHGRSVAWGARRFGARCVIYLHATVSQGRADAIASYGAEIRRVPGNYDDAVRAAAAAADSEGWIVVSDTSYPGYTEIPREVMQGYRVMMDEALDQVPAPPTHVFIQAGVGGLAAAMSVEARARLPQPPRLVVVEPDHAACLLASAEAGRQTTLPGDLDTIMAGLACGEPSLLAWQELDRAAYAFMALPDASAIDAMRWLAARAVVSGESGAPGLAALFHAAADPEARRVLGLDAHSRILLFNTEGATDPDLYAQLLHP